MILQMPYTSRGFQHLKPNLQHYAVQTASADNFGKISPLGFNIRQIRHNGLSPDTLNNSGYPSYS